MAGLNEELTHWLDTHADSLDADNAHADAVLPMLAGAGLAKVGVPEENGGSGGPLSQAAAVVAKLAEHSLNAAFVYWAQRAVIECFLNSDNRALVDRLLPSLLDGSRAGAPALSNAMKHLGGLEPLHLHFAPGAGTLKVNGAIRWASNLRRDRFVAVAAASDESGGPAGVLAIPGESMGFERLPDFDLTALRGTNTAAARLGDIALDEGWRLHPDAAVFLPRVRPALLALQCGLGLGLARASLRSIREARLAAAPGLLSEAQALQSTADGYWQRLAHGIDNGLFRGRAGELVSLRLQMVELAMAAARLELQALGGSSFIRGRSDGFTRRWKESAFLAVVTPTVVQLKTELDKMST
jgi:alkylation response protein AidB-like acyl-CoA dehydrogenase